MICRFAVMSYLVSSSIAYVVVVMPAGELTQTEATVMTMY